MKRFWLTFILALATALLTGVMFYMALRRHYPEWDQLHLFNTSLSGMMAMFSVVAAGLFVYSVHNFRTELRRAYALLCVGIILFGLAQVQFPLASYIDAFFWYEDGLIGIPYLIAVVFIFVGVRSVAGILKVQTRWASFKWLLAASVVTPVLVAFLPHAASDLTMVQLVGSNALTAFDAVFLFFAVMTIVRIRQVIGPRYVHAMTWLAVAFAANVVAGVVYILVNLVTTSTFNWYYYDAMTAEVFFAGAVLLVYAGYAMVMVDQPDRAVSAPESGAHAVVTLHGLPLVDIITYLASLTSKPQEIDPTLDVLREVTARLSPGQHLSADDERRLMVVYRDIERYLTTDEPLRIYTPQELHDRLSWKFGLEQGAVGQLWQTPA